MLTARDHVEALRARVETERARTEAEADILMRMTEVVPDLMVREATCYTRALGLTDSVMLQLLRGGCDAKFDDPALVLAVPTMSVLGRMVRYVQGYIIATERDQVLYPEPGWDRHMQDHGVPDPVITACRITLVERGRQNW